jgi:hypothetical protein
MFQFCRNVEHFRFHDVAWKFLWSVSKNNIPGGIFQYMEVKKQLKKLLDLVSLGLPELVTTYAIEFVCKVLEYPDKLAAKFQKSSDESKLDAQALTTKKSADEQFLKTVEADVKAFTSVLVKHCAKVHLIYKSLVYKNLDGAPKLVFSIFFSFYFFLCFFFNFYWNYFLANCSILFYLQEN